MTSHLGPRPYLELLRDRGEPSEPVRVRVALDVLGLLAGRDASPRGPASPRIDQVVVTSDGRVELVDPGDGSGAATLVWEVVAGRAAETPPPRLHDVLDEIHPDVDAVIDQALRAGEPWGTTEQLVEDLAAAAQGRIATRERVMLELGAPPPRSVPPRSAPPPSGRSARTSGPASSRAPRSNGPPSVRAGGPPSSRASRPPPTPTAPPPSTSTPSTPDALTPSAPTPSTPTPTAPPPSATIPSAPPPSAPASASAAPSDAPRSHAGGAPRPPPNAPPPPVDPAPLDPFDDDWTLPAVPAPPAPRPASAPAPATTPPPSRRPSIHVPDDVLTTEEQERAAAIQRRAQERAAFVRDGARAVAARRLAAEHAAAERAAEEARVAEQARLAAAAAEAEARATSEDLQREGDSRREEQALRRAAGMAAQLMTGALDVPSAFGSRTAVDPPARSVLLIMPSSPEREELSRALRDAGFGLSVHHDARSALAAAPRIQPACIVADYDLPDTTGDAAARQLRARRSELALTPFLLLAFHNEKRSGLARFALGADVCMNKPFDPDEVVGQVAALVNMAARLVSARRAFPTLEPGNGRGFGGDLIHMSIAAILTVVELERRTGTFHLTSDGRVAELEIVNGLLVSGAVSGFSMAPVGALRVMLAWRNGRFAFEPRPHRDAPENAQSISDTLTAAMRFERAQPLQIERAQPTQLEVLPAEGRATPTELSPPTSERGRDPRAAETATPALRLRPRDSKGR